MTLTPDMIRRVVSVAHAREAGFVELVGMAELDPARAFKGAVMKGGDLRGQDLSGFNFEQTNFAGADLTGANLSRTTGLTEANLQGAIYDGTTQFPPSLRAAMRAALARAKDPRHLGPAGRAPDWAETWGIDIHGPWVTFSVAAADGTRVEQRLRWCSPGRFLMGSPPEEAGRYDNEGPQHEVTLKTGFWLFDTQCTQALWQAVMGDNPSEFQSPTRPVEHVSYRDARKFLAAINKRVKGSSKSR